MPSPAAPPSPLWGNTVLLAFLFAQASDGVLTYVGIVSYGPQIEGNPIVAWYIGALGAAAAIVATKAFAMFCAATLHLRARHRTLGALTFVYLAAAVWPWMRVLSYWR